MAMMGLRQARGAAGYHVMPRNPGNLELASIDRARDLIGHCPRIRCEEGLQVTIQSSRDNRTHIEAGKPVLVGTDRHPIVAETECLLRDEAAYRSLARAGSPFGNGHAAEPIARIIAKLPERTLSERASS